MYNQSLYSVITPIRSNTIVRLNKSKKWEYGYNKEHDVVVISKTGRKVIGGRTWARIGGGRGKSRG